ncbi:MAG: hypothetical protein FJ118_02100 [Deltaproteobacteria bacterium]|nr:hypothetical protein [Deltaproteobacteria bacterium]
MTSTTRIGEITTSLNLAMQNLRCLHTLTGRAPQHKLCANAYDCGACPFDQMLDDMAQPERVTDRAGSIRAA